MIRQAKRLCTIICALTLLLGSAAITAPVPLAAKAEPIGGEAPRLLSGNRLGSLFPGGTVALATYADYRWQISGLHSADAAFAAADSGEILADGEAGDGGIATADKTGEAYGTLIYDLKGFYQVSSVQVWTAVTAESGFAQVEVYTSLDGAGYRRAGALESADTSLTGQGSISVEILPGAIARYVKIIVHKDPQKRTLRLAEAAVWGHAAEAQALLSGNLLRADGPYGLSTPTLDTKASYQWGTDQPFPTEPGLIASDNEAGAKQDGAGGAPDLTDGSGLEEAADYAASSATGAQGKYATVTFDLKDMYQVGQIDVWTKADNARFMDGFEVLASTDGITYFSLGYTANPNSRYAGAMVKTEAFGLSGMNARYLRIILHNALDSDQLIAGEIAVWGWRLYDPALPKTDMPDQVEFTAELKNFRTLHLDWSSYNSVVNKVNKYGVYAEKTDFATTAGLSPKATAENGSVEQKGKHLLYSALEPDTTYYVAVTPFSSASGERKDVRTVKLRTPGVLGGEKVGDLFSINDSPYGGGNYVHHGAKEDLNLIRKLMLMRNIEGINNSRWWTHDSWVNSMYAKFGLGFHLFYHGDQYVREDNKRGAWSFSTYNEPDLKGRPVADVAAAIKANHDSMKAVDSRNLLVEPALGGTEPASMTWLENLYKSDGQNGARVRTYFDVLDVHPYVKYSEGKMPGLTEGAPEMLIGKIRDIKALMAKYGDAAKPIVFTELGWSTYTGGGYLKAVDRVTQRNYLARSYMHAAAGGVKSLFWYSLQDDGTDASNLEHNLGIIDWYGNPKPSYYGYYTLSKVLKDTQYMGEAAGVEHPYYGYDFWDEGKNSVITSLWAANEDIKSAVLATEDSSLTVVGIDGSLKHMPVSGGRASVTISGAPVFIYSAAGVKVLSVDNSYMLTESSVDARRGETVTVHVERYGLGTENPGRLDPVLPEGWQTEGELGFGPGNAPVVLTLRIPLNAEEKQYEIPVQVVAGTEVAASLKLTVNVLETVRVTIAAEPVASGDWAQWNAAVYLENRTPDMVLSGSVSVRDAVYLTMGEALPQTFGGLQPGAQTKLVFPISELPERSRASVAFAVQLDNGYTKTVQRPFNILAAVFDGAAPVADGILSPGEWAGAMPISVNRADQIKNIIGWGGAEDLSGTGYVKWDRGHLYLAMDVQDNLHMQNGTDGDIWQGDSLQFAIDTGRVNGAGSAQNNEFGMALGPNGVTVWRWMSGNGKPAGELETVRAAVYRSGTHTVYELALPWKEVLPENQTPQAGGVLGFSLLINENDGSGRRGWMEYMSGIGSSKNTQLFGDLLLMRAEEAAEVPVTGVTLDRHAAELAVGGALDLTAAVAPANADNTRVFFSTGRSDLVSVTQAVYGGATARITGLKPGTALVSAVTEDGGYTAVSVITVTGTQGPEEPVDPGENPGTGDPGTGPEEGSQPGDGGQGGNSSAAEPTVQGAGIFLPALMPGTDGLAKVSLQQAELEAAIRNARALGADSLTVAASAAPGLAGVTVGLPATVAGGLPDAIGWLKLNVGDAAEFSVAAGPLSASVNRAGGEVELSVMRTDAENGNARYDFAVRQDGKDVLKPGSGLAAFRLSFPYEGAAGEAVHRITAARVEADGSLTLICAARLDPLTGRMIVLADRGGRYTAVYRDAGFTDAAEAPWARKAIEGLAARGVAEGMEKNRFVPGAALTRAEFVQLLINAFSLANERAEAPFTDVEKTAWYYRAVASAQALGIVQGYEDGTFGGGNMITRAEMAALLYRTLEAAGRTPARGAGTESFADAREFPAYAREALDRLLSAGIISGLEDGRFAPEETATRAQAAVIIYNALMP
ncbi:S-layer homology domain-containing protein [Paenibacillus sp. YN15]|uniref:S-layer homology domain-containing protein n=1 Tax=Paenibacillus sp. YN15 TaxID=1742774 RepID=UPI000DCDCB4D|nr:S-layer homology domain-containing protein [Paenibacillus sp. YN15]RAV06417.1 hypothetical protein DQG13_00845 [Paenibacillus sp. YN15]